MSATVLTIEGSRIDGIAGFYAEINRLFMANEDWQLGHSLDALNDLFHGGYGTGAGGPVTLHWRDMEHSRKALGPAATIAHLVARLDQPTYDQPALRARIAALQGGTGPSYFDEILEIIAEHPRITLLPG
ncbi:MAG: hypothetical protein Q4G36_01020 [Paracoccus sp. (in: a-proteobacteria)]|nr:hypothetical protein [Paracoccus sp. (in: a-proteobacteria)]